MKNNFGRIQTAIFDARSLIENSLGSYHDGTNSFYNALAEILDQYKRQLLSTQQVTKLVLCKF